MIEVREQKDKYRTCNCCGKRYCKKLKEISYGMDRNLRNIFTICEKCQLELMEKLWE